MRQLSLSMPAQQEGLELLPLPVPQVTSQRYLLLLGQVREVGHPWLKLSRQRLPLLLPLHQTLQAGWTSLGIQTRRYDNADSPHLLLDHVRQFIILERLGRRGGGAGKNARVRL